MDVDFAGVKQYVFGRLDGELSDHLVYHNLEHTKENVLPAATEFAAISGIDEEDLLLLQTAAVYHDIGFIEQTVGHEEVGVRIAVETLPQFGYDPSQIETIGEIIMATKLPQTPKNILGQLLADADLDVLGRSTFFEATTCLRLELAAEGVHQTDEEWYRSQTDFLEGHTYFTAAARTLRMSQKRKNLKALKNLLYQCQH